MDEIIADDFQLDLVVADEHDVCRAVADELDVHRAQYTTAAIERLFAEDMEL